MQGDELFSVQGRVALVTGGAGALGGAMARALAQRGAKVAILDVVGAEAAAGSIGQAGGQSLGLPASVLDRPSLESAAQVLLDRWGRLDILINTAGGNKPEATAMPDRPFPDLTPEALRSVVDLNLHGTILPCQVLGKIMADQQEGVIVNISSMCAVRPLTRVVGYSAAKAAVTNFTQWLAVHMAQNYSPRIRVNAMAPGFFETDQNRYLLRDQRTGALTARGRVIIDHTPVGRFGEPDDLIGTLIWLVSPAAQFVTGIVVPVDGGFSAFSGV